MKKFIQVSLIILGLFTSSLAAEKIDEKSFDKLMTLSGINKQIQEYPDVIKASFNQDENIDEKELQERNFIIDKSFEAKKILKTIGDDVKKKITNKDIENLLVWYESDLGKKITKAEEESSTPEAYQDMIQNTSTIMQDKKKVFFAKRVDKLLDVTNMVSELQKNTATAIFSANNHPTKAEMAIFRSQLSLESARIKENVEKMVILSFAYSYRNIDEKELKSYMSFLKQEDTQKFNKAVMSGIVKALNNSVADMSSLFSQMSK